MSGFFYIETDEGEYYELTVTTSISVSYRSSTTDHPVEDGFYIVDHNVLEPVTISYRGMISNITNLALSGKDTQRSVSENFQKLVALRDSKKPFTVHVDNRATEDNILPPYTNCVFSSLDFSRTDKNTDSYEVAISLKQIRIVRKALQISQPEEVAKQSSELRVGSSNSTTNMNYSLAVDGGKALIDLLTNTTTNRIVSDLNNTN